MSCQLISNKQPNKTASVMGDLIFQTCQIEMNLSKLVRFISRTEDRIWKVEMYKMIWNSVFSGRGTRDVLGKDLFQRCKLIRISKWILGIKRQLRRNGNGYGGGYYPEGLGSIGVKWKWPE